MSDEVPDTKQAARDALRERFRARVSGDASELQRHWRIAASMHGAPRRESLDAIQHIAHRLSGLGGMFGHPSISEAAGRLEQACATALSEQESRHDVPAKDLSVRIAALAAALNDAAR